MNGLNLLPAQIIDWLKGQGRSLEITRPGDGEEPTNPKEPHTMLVFHTAELEGVAELPPVIVGGEPIRRKVRRLQSRYAINITDRFAAQMGPDYVWRKVGQEVEKIEERFINLEAPENKNKT